MSNSVDPFLLLKKRADELILKYLEPTIFAERKAVEEEQPLPPVDFDNFAAFRLLTHAELEGYFETKAQFALDDLHQQFKLGKPATAKFAALIFLYLWKQRHIPAWTDRAGTDSASRKAEEGDFKNLAQMACGYGRQFIKDNNGIKENSIYVLSGLMGYFSDELDEILVAELNQYGKNRGDVAHESWTKNTRVFDGAEVEKNRLLLILELTEKFYEKNSPHLPRVESNRFRETLARWFN